MSTARSKIYFASDAHLGSLAVSNSREQELKFIRFLDYASLEGSHIFLLGDILDFWFEYKRVVPKGFTRLFGKLSQLSDQGIEIHWFIGNHDIWMFGYLEQECGVQIHPKAEFMTLMGKQFYIGHGDELDPGKAFRITRSIFHNKLCQKLFALIPSQLGIGFGLAWSRKSRLHYKQGGHTPFMGEQDEYMVRFAKETLRSREVDFFVFGHRHILYDLLISKQSRLLIIGDWMFLYSYAVYDGQTMQLELFEQS